MSFYKNIKMRCVAGSYTAKKVYMTYMMAEKKYYNIIQLYFIN